MLFLSLIKPHRPVTSQRIKEVMSEAGIDTTKFSAHSVRGASATAAKEKGVPLADILHTADWSSGSTFTRFYYRPGEKADYARKVLTSDT